MAAADAAALTAAYRAGTATVEVDGAPVPLEDGDLIVTETPREGWTVASGGGLTVALDLTLTPELERAGLVREVVRLVQEARKNSGLEVTDRIELWWTGDGGSAEALEEHAEPCAGEVLATAVHARARPATGRASRARRARGSGWPAPAGGPGGLSLPVVRPRRPLGEGAVGRADRARGEAVGPGLVDRERDRRRGRRGGSRRGGSAGARRRRAPRP